MLRRANRRPPPITFVGAARRFFSGVGTYRKNRSKSLIPARTVDTPQEADNREAWSAWPTYLHSITGRQIKRTAVAGRPVIYGPYGASRGAERRVAVESAWTASTNYSRAHIACHRGRQVLTDKRRPPRAPSDAVIYASRDGCPPQRPYIKLV